MQTLVVVLDLMNDLLKGQTLRNQLVYLVREQNHLSGSRTRVNDCNFLVREFIHHQITRNDCGAIGTAQLGRDGDCKGAVGLTEYTCPIFGRRAGGRDCGAGCLQGIERGVHVERSVVHIGQIAGVQRERNNGERYAGGTVHAAVQITGAINSNFEVHRCHILK